MAQQTNPNQQEGLEKELLTHIRTISADLIGIEPQTITQMSDFRDDLGATPSEILKLLSNLEAMYGCTLDTDEKRMLIRQMDSDGLLVDDIIASFVDILE